ncbi:formate dehydrogenase, putative [Perkinsus marinus ATCC 50983]|uniref:Formate dehydrogenase, putative n=1 Tax=Perkinsus marinus (strain ATCC 50983 / TXsc) TaxID=423536 RepID=C5LGV3_PERM5|nr:formate dehydrogenase, putative [Perkinsus marinus ATCC 50983]EER04040.1 formate dehydrogenase, putative [Perkinsus marinus ATCC 50983]|eukprot:XP_002772224.1 formate dehydrogenase, putative [Perkinsus marinus ATCC 50983]
MVYMRMFMIAAAGGKMTLGKVVCVLYNDPIDGYPPKYARDDIPNISIHFKPGTLLGCVSGELGIRQLVEDHGYEFIVTSDKDGDDSYMTEKRFKMAPKLKLCITAGIGSDHVDLEAAAQNNVTVAELLKVVGI